MILLSFAAAITLAGTYPAASPCHEKTDAWSALLAVQNVVKNELRSPRNAKFQKLHLARYAPTGRCEYVVGSWVDAQNGFGAEIRTEFVAKVRSNDGGKTWVVVEHGYP